MRLPLVSALVVLLAACGTVEPQSDAVLVVEAFLAEGETTPTVVVRESQTVWGDMVGDNPVSDAEVMFGVNGDYTALEPLGEGVYRADSTRMLFEGLRLRVDVRRGSDYASGVTGVPPAISIDSVRVRPSERPVEAVLIDSLQLGVSAPETGWLYLVDVSIWWRDRAIGDSTYVRARIRPEVAFGSPVVDFFLRSDHIFKESTAPIAGNVRRWDGVYAVRVDRDDARLPSHEVSVALLRSGRDYARYASSRSAPERREPTGNVVGGIGIVAGIAVDSTRISVSRP